jgi:hypothetical protein
VADSCQDSRSARGGPAPVRPPHAESASQRHRARHSVQLRTVPPRRVRASCRARVSPCSTGQAMASDQPRPGSNAGPGPRIKRRSLWYPALSEPVRPVDSSWAFQLVSVYSGPAPCGGVAARVAASRRGQARFPGRGLNQQAGSYWRRDPDPRASLVAALVAGVLAAGACSSPPHCPPGASCPAIVPRVTFTPAINGKSYAPRKDGHVPSYQVRPRRVSRGAHGGDRAEARPGHGTVVRHLQRDLGLRIERPGRNEPPLGSLPPAAVHRIAHVQPALAYPRTPPGRQPLLVTAWSSHQPPTEVDYTAEAPCHRKPSDGRIAGAGPCWSRSSRCKSSTWSSTSVWWHRHRPMRRPRTFARCSSTTVTCCAGTRCSRSPRSSGCSFRV